MDSEDARARFNAEVARTSIKYYNPDGQVSDSPYDTMKAWEKDHRVADDYAGRYRISTIWLFIDHGFHWQNDAVPLIFETMVFPDGGYEELAMRRYATREEALEGHAQLLAQFSQRAEAERSAGATDGDVAVG